MKLPEIWVLGSSNLFQDLLRAEALSLKTFTTRQSLESALNRKNKNKSFPGLVLVDGDAEDTTSVRALASHTSPLFVISKKKNPSEIVEYLRAGALDYFLKDSDPCLLVAKVRSQLQSGEINDARATLPIEVSFPPPLIRHASGPQTELTLKEFKIFMALYRRYPVPMTRADIQAEVWTTTQVVDKTFDVHLFRLRRKIESLNLKILYRPSGEYHLVNESN